jgi:PhnB protein
MKINPYLGFNGTCEAAFNFYHKVLGGKIVMMLKCGESPMADKMPKEMHNRIMHARLEIDGSTLMGGDCPSEIFTPSAGMTININVDDPKEAERVFAALSENGKITMPLAETFWAARFGMFTDQYGTPWMINCEKQLGKV